MRTIPPNLLAAFESSQYSPVLLLDLFFFSESEFIYRPFRLTSSDIDIWERVSSSGTITAPPIIPQEGCNAQFSNESDFNNTTPGSVLTIGTTTYNLTYKDYHSLQVILDPPPPIITAEDFIIATPYTARGFSIEPISFGNSTFQNELGVEIEDIDRTILAAIGGIGIGEFPIQLTVAALNDDGEIIGQPDASAKLTIFKGFISNWEYRPGKVLLNAQSIITRWNQNTLSTHSISCRWLVFGGAECKYVIPPGQNETCNRTYTQCLVYNNTVNFGGFRWLTSLENKDLVWGQRQPEKVE